MSSIPVKKGGLVARRSGIAKINENSNDKSSDSKLTMRQSGKENKTRPFLRQGSKKELEDENTRLKDLIQIHEQKFKDLESKVNLIEEELSAAKNEACKVTETCEKKLLSCNIDPVSLTMITTDAEQESVIQKCGEESKLKVEILKKKMKQFNSWAENCISDLEEISSQLETSCETSSS